jgi:hypothetical protein
MLIYIIEGGVHMPNNNSTRIGTTVKTSVRDSPGTRQPNTSSAPAITTIKPPKK